MFLEIMENVHQQSSWTKGKCEEEINSEQLKVLIVKTNDMVKRHNKQVEKKKLS